MSRFYNDLITELFLHPQHAGCLAHPTVTTQAGSPGQSDVLELQLQITDHIVEQARFRAHGKLTTIAAGEYLCQWIEQKPVEQLKVLKAQHIIEALQLPSTRISSAILAQQALMQALDDGSKASANIIQ